MQGKSQCDLRLVIYEAGTERSGVMHEGKLEAQVRLGQDQHYADAVNDPQAFDGVKQPLAQVYMYLVRVPLHLVLLPCHVTKMV